MRIAPVSQRFLILGAFERSIDFIPNLKIGNTLGLGRPGILVQDAAHKTRRRSGTERLANPLGVRRHDEDEPPDR